MRQRRHARWRSRGARGYRRGQGRLRRVAEVARLNDVSPSDVFYRLAAQRQATAPRSASAFRALEPLTALVRWKDTTGWAASYVVRLSVTVDVSRGSASADSPLTGRIAGAILRSRHVPGSSRRHQEPAVGGRGAQSGARYHSVSASPSGRPTAIGASGWKGSGALPFKSPPL